MDRLRQERLGPDPRVRVDVPEHDVQRRHAPQPVDEGDVHPPVRFHHRLELHRTTAHATLIHAITARDVTARDPTVHRVTVGR